MYAVSFFTFGKPSILTTIRFYYRNYTDMDSGVFLSYGSKAILKIEHLLFFLRNCMSCVHNCEDHSSFDFISAVLIWFISYTSITFISFTGTYEHIIDQLPTLVASWLKWLDHRTSIAKPRVQIRLKSGICFSGLLRNCIVCVHNCEDHSSFDLRTHVWVWKMLNQIH